MSVLQLLTTMLEKSVTSMSDSGEKINYSVRPAKCVERKIMCDLVSLFPNDKKTNEYRYIGFGSFYFSDFILFHQQLGINKMISIEKSENKERYEYNRPYNCISIKFCDAQQALTKEIPFFEDDRDIVWLDYDSVFCKEYMYDVMTAAQKINKGSFLFVSFNRSNLPDENRLDSLKKEYGDYLPNLKETEIDYISLPNIIYTILKNSIEKVLSERNLALEFNLKATSIFFIKYRDGAPMITIGYYFHDENDTQFEETLENTSLPGVTNREEPFNLIVPCFTRAEIRDINRYLPGTTADEIYEKLTYLKKKDIESYVALYKYYPNYLDTPYYT